jgi:isocitrate dehydrogenase (NAD+)
MTHKICLIPGDGIGPEVTSTAVEVLEASGAKIDWVRVQAGGACAQATGQVIPLETLEAIREYRLGLKGPITTPIGKGFMSANVALRKKFDLYAAVRPVRSLKGVKTRYENIEIVVIRENTEGLYSGIEHEVVPGVVESLKIATKKGCERIARFAFEYARKNHRKKVTVFHKANIMKLSDGLFIECAKRIHEEVAPEIEYQEMIIDNGCMQLVRDPAQFDVLLLENLYGDMISDLCSGLVGGLGVVPGANIGEDCAIFEAVHGSAPDIAGKGIANPLACIMSGVMLLNHIGEAKAAEKIKAAYNKVLTEGDPQSLTRDLGGQAGTKQFVQAVLKHL